MSAFARARSILVIVALLCCCASKRALHSDGGQCHTLYIPMAIKIFYQSSNTLLRARLAQRRRRRRRFKIVRTLLEVLYERKYEKEEEGSDSGIVPQPATIPNRCHIYPSTPRNRTIKHNLSHNENLDVPDARVRARARRAFLPRHASVHACPSHCRIAALSRSIVRNGLTVGFSVSVFRRASILSYTNSVENSAEVCVYAIIWMTAQLYAANTHILITTLFALARALTFLPIC